MRYDIIGDIHGEADKLHALMARLGYVQSSGAYRKQGHTTIFVGDFIDIGPQQVDTVMTVRRMVDTGAALATMGNHEFNAIAWHTEDPGNLANTCDRIRGQRATETVSSMQLVS